MTTVSEHKIGPQPMSTHIPSEQFQFRSEEPGMGVRRETRILVSWPYTVV